MPPSSAVETELSRYIDRNWSIVGMTNDRAAHEFGIKSANMISMWRMGRSPVSLQHIPMLAKLLKADEMYLVALWLKQLCSRDENIPVSLVERIESKLLPAN